MEYLVETRDKEYIVNANDYDITEDYIDFKKPNGLFLKSVAYFRINDVISIIGKEETENQPICEGKGEPKW